MLPLTGISFLADNLCHSVCARKSLRTSRQKQKAKRRAYQLPNKSNRCDRGGEKRPNASSLKEAAPRYGNRRTPPRGTVRQDQGLTEDDARAAARLCSY